MSEAEPIVIDAQGAAKLLRMGVDKTRRLTEAGVIPGRKIGGEFRYSRIALLRWLEGENQYRAGAVEPCDAMLLPVVPNRIEQLLSKPSGRNRKRQSAETE